MSDSNGTPITLKFSLDNVIEASDSVLTGPGRVAEPAVAEIGEGFKELFVNLVPGSRWSGRNGKPNLYPIPKSILNVPILHRNGPSEINPKQKAQNFATKVKSYIQANVKETYRNQVLVSVVPHKQLNAETGLPETVYCLSLFRYARMG